jgi:hypothetical protein
MCNRLHIPVGKKVKGYFFLHTVNPLYTGLFYLQGWTYVSAFDPSMDDISLAIIKTKEVSKSYCSL